jgi:hypothetical protein
MAPAGPGWKDRFVTKGAARWRRRERCMPAVPGHSEFDNVPADRNEARFRLSQAVASIGNWEIDLHTRKMWGSEEALDRKSVV